MTDSPRPPLPSSLKLAAALVAIQGACFAWSATHHSTKGGFDALSVALCLHFALCVVLGRAAFVERRSWVAYGLLPGFLLFLGPWLSLAGLTLAHYFAPAGGKPGPSRSRTALQAIAVIVLLFGGYAAWNANETYKVRGFCESLKPGAAVSTLAGRAESFGLSSRWLKPFQDTDGHWVPLLVPVRTTMGDCACRIDHDGQAVKSAAMSCH